MTRHHRLLRAPLAAAVAVLAFPLAAATPDPVAMVGELSISRQELDEAVQRAVNAGYYHKRLPDETLQKLRREQLRQLVRRRLDILGGRDNGLEAPVADAAGRRAAMEIELGKKAYEESLRVRGWSRADHVKALADTLLGQEAYRRFVSQAAKVTDDAVRRAYDANPARWKVPPSLHLRHILLKVPPAASAVEWKKREAEAAALRKRAESGERFAKLASSHSEGMYRVKGGDLGWVHRGRLQPELEKAAWTASPGAVVGPVHTLEGVHLLLVEERRGGRQLTFDEVEATLRKELEKQALAVAEARWYQEVRSRHPVTILDPTLLADGDLE